MTSDFRVAWLAPTLLAVAAALTAGCILFAPVRQRPDPALVRGPAPYVENCVLCHAEPTAANYLESRHAAAGIRCGQCHMPVGHPDFTVPVRDGKCGGCHQPEYQQTLASQHFAARILRPLDGDRAARKTLRADGFTARTATGRSFVGDDSSGDLGGRLCAACHYDEHRLGLKPVHRADFCTTCHGDRAQHYDGQTTAGGNRCVSCHVQVGKTVAGQVVNTHLFAIPGAADTAR